MTDYDFIVIGAGMSGASAAWALTGHGRTLLLETEEVPGYHSTGRSAALYTPNYGPAPVRALNSAGHAFFRAPPPGFADRPLLTPRGALTLARAGKERGLENVLALATERHPIHPVTHAEAMRMAPFLRPSAFSAALLEPGVADMDVAAIHQGFLATFRNRGGQLALGHGVRAIERRGGYWAVSAGTERFRAPLVVNAAGAWGDEIAAMAGLPRLGLSARRRTMIGVACDIPGLPHMPLAEFAGEEAYLKPDTGRILASPGDETPVAPQDIQPEEWDIAVVADWLQRHTVVPVRSVQNSWAGLRTFLPDRLPAAGFAVEDEGFFWLVGQGGFGIMMAPALARVAESLICGQPWPAELEAEGLTPDQLSPARLRLVKETDESCLDSAPRHRTGAGLSH